MIEKSLPGSWIETTLGDAFSWGSGGTPKRTNPVYYDGDIPWLIIRDLNDSYVSDSKNQITESGLSNSSAKWVEPGSILIAMYGSIGKLGIATKRLTTNQAIAFTQPGLVNGKYLYYYLRSIRTLLNNQGKGVAQKNISQTVLNAFPFILAPRTTQDKIVETIDELFSHVDAGVEGLKQSKAKLQQYRQSVLKDAVTGKLTEKWRDKNTDILESADKLLGRILEDRRENWEAEQLKIFEEKGKTPKDDKWKEKYKVVDSLTEKIISGLPLLPEGWSYAKLGQLIEDPKYGTSKKCTYESKGKGVLRIPNIAAGEINSEDMKFAEFSGIELDTYKLNEGDILTIRSNGSVSLVGKCAVISEKDRDFLFAGYLIRLRPILKHVDPHYLKSVLASGFLRKQIETLAKSSSGVNNINTGELQSLIIPICSLKEQQANAEDIDAKNIIIDRQFEQYEKLFIKASKKKSSILAKAFAGELVENIETDETAAQLLEKIQVEKQLLKEKVKLAQKKPKARTKKMEKRPIIDVLKESGKSLKVEELFELAGFQYDVSPEGIEVFYQELKTVAEDEHVEVTPVNTEKKDTDKDGNDVIVIIKQHDIFEYKEVKENEAG